MAGSSVGTDGAEIAGGSTGASRFTLGASAAKDLVGAAALGDALTGNCGKASLRALAVRGSWTAGSGGQTEGGAGFGAGFGCGGGVARGAGAAGAVKESDIRCPKSGNRHNCF
jgi:hypothetical protein